MDTKYDNGIGTVVALADGTASLYTSSGGGVIGAGNYDQVRFAVVQLLRLAEANLELLADGAPAALPSKGNVLITVLTYSGQRRVSAPEQDLRHSEHPASPIFHAVHKVIFEMRRAEAAYRAARETLPDGTTRLMAAAHSGDLGAVTSLLDHGAVVDARDDRGYTALMYAANAGQEEAVGVLLSRGADPNAADRQMTTALMFAAQHDHVDIVRQLLNEGVELNARGDHGLSALGFAQQNQHPRTASVLIAAGAL